MNIRLLIICIILGGHLTSYSQQRGRFKDPRDKKIYKTVKIGSQTWFAENLAFKPESGNYWAYDNQLKNIKKYGYLYDWETAKAVCPTGWHLPDESEWAILCNFLGGDSIAGGKMKAIHQWGNDVNNRATNESGFNALPAGGRNSAEEPYFDIYQLGICANFWSSTAKGSDWATAPSLFFADPRLYNPDGEDAYPRTNGFSVRCIKDKQN
jgi:uncharacterized protein (TIGR02145 family)